MRGTVLLCVHDDFVGRPDVIRTDSSRLVGL